jgi:hypothetical protein
VCVIVLPCGKSAHLEAGYAIGAGKPTVIMLENGDPELMYKMTPYICVDIQDVVKSVNGINKSKEYLNQNEIMALKLALVKACEDAADSGCPNESQLYQCDKCEDCIDENGIEKVKCWKNYYLLEVEKCINEINKSKGAEENDKG